MGYGIRQARLYQMTYGLSGQPEEKGTLGSTTNLTVGKPVHCKVLGAGFRVSFDPSCGALVVTGVCLRSLF